MTKFSQADQNTLEGLQQELSSYQAREEELSNRCEDLQEQLADLRGTAELERYRTLEEERKKWEACEERLVIQLETLQREQQRFGLSESEEVKAGARSTPREPLQ